jgi:aryl-alcohol dehydrogenase-like predicted oxidoreductase
VKYRKLGRSGLDVSVLCLGTMTFGEPVEGSMMHGVGTPWAASHDILSAALDAGVNFIDTADIYGEDGLSERVIGDWFHKTGRRDEVVLATKFRFKMKDGPNGTGASRLRIVRGVEESLRRLQTDRIDLYQIHMQDLDCPEEELLRALDDLVRAGKVHYLGASNYAAYRLVDSLWTAKSQGWSRFVSLQMQYSLAERALEREHVPLCRQWGLGIIPWSPLAGGFLTGKYSRGASAPPGTRLEKWHRWLQQYGTERGWATVDALRAIAAERGVTPGAVALAWLLAQDTVSSVIFGARTRAQLDENLVAADLALTAEELARLTQASQSPAGYPYDFIARTHGRW